MKKLLALILAAVMLLPLAACVEDKENESDTTAETSADGVPEGEVGDGEESYLDEIVNKIARKETVYYDDTGYYKDAGRVREQLFYDKDDLLIYKLVFHRNGFAAEWHELDSNGVVVKRYERGEESDWVIAQERETDKDGNVIKYTRYDEDGSVYTIENYTYEGGKLVKEEGEDPEDGEITLSDVYEYDADGRLIKVTSSSYGETDSYIEYTYDSAGNMIKENRVDISDPGRNSYTTYEYDGNGNLIKKIPSSKTSRSTVYTYDEGGKLITVNELSSTGDTYFVEKYTYYEDGSVHTKTDASRITTEYDALGRVIKKTSADGAEYVEAYSYDEAGNLIKIAITKGGVPTGVYSMEYDTDGDQTKWAYEDSTDAAKSGSFVYEFDENGFRVKTTQYDKDGNTVTAAA